MRWLIIQPRITRVVISKEFTHLENVMVDGRASVRLISAQIKDLEIILFNRDQLKLNNALKLPV